jgi:hypothetical protein
MALFQCMAYMHLESFFNMTMILSIQQNQYKSPDSNPIEDLCPTQKRKLNHCPTPPKGLLESWERVFETFHSITFIE